MEVELKEYNVLMFDVWDSCVFKDGDKGKV